MRAISEFDFCKLECEDQFILREEGHVDSAVHFSEELVEDGQSSLIEFLFRDLHERIVLRDHVEYCVHKEGQ
jgi:hypothetical protein